MNPRAVAITPRAQRDLKGLPDDVRAEMLLTIHGFASGSLPNADIIRRRVPLSYRLRIGNYRAFLAFDADTVTILNVCHRREAYGRRRGLNRD